MALQTASHDVASSEEAPVLSIARIAGLLYLAVIVCAGFAQAVRSSVIASGDAAATAENILDSERLFRLGFSSDIVAFACDIGLAVALYVLLKPVNQTIALLAAFFRLAQAATLGVNLVMQFMALLLLSGEGYLSGFDAEQLNVLALLFLEAHGYGYLLGLVFFGCSTFLLGYLVIKSEYLPGLWGALLMLAAVGYLVDSFAGFLIEDRGIVSTIAIAPAALVEVTFCLWLLIRGGRVQVPPEPAGM
jgi:hypothetical protein